MSVSTATLLPGSSLIIASRIASLIWSAILSGWPSVTDSEVNSRRATFFSIHCSADWESVAAAGDRRRRTAVSAQPRDDQIPDDAGQGVLGPPRNRRLAAVCVEHDGLVVAGAEPEPAAHLVDQEQLGSLAGQLGLGGRQVQD